MIFFILLFSLSNVDSQSDTLSVGYAYAPPFVMTNDNGELYGISVWLWEKTAEDLEINYRYQEMTFKDMMDSLATGQLDVSINPLTISSDRAKVMDFSLPYYSTNSVVAVVRPSGWRRIFDFLKSIFNLNFIRVVAGLLFLIGTFGLFVWFFERKKNPEHFRPGPRGIWDGLWWSAVTMTTVGYGDKHPKSKGGKLIALVWMFSGIIFISGFTASIASTLTVNSIYDSADELMDFKDRTIGCVKGTSTVDFLTRYFFKNVKNYDNVDDGLNALQHGDIRAFLYDEPILKHKLLEYDDFHQIVLLPIKFNNQFYAFAFRPNLGPLRDEFNRMMIGNIESFDWRILLSEYNLEEL